MKPTYDFKIAAESGWFVLTTVVLVVLQAVVAQPTLPDDPKAWIIAVGGACVRALIGAIVSLVTTSKTTGGVKASRRKNV